MTAWLVSNVAQRARVRRAASVRPELRRVDRKGTFLRIGAARKSAGKFGFLTAVKGGLEFLGGYSCDGASSHRIRNLVMAQVTLEEARRRRENESSKTVGCCPALLLPEPPLLAR